MNAPLKKDPMLKQHEGLGNHKQRLQSHGAVLASAPGSPKTTGTGKPGQNGGTGLKTGHTKTNT